MEDLERITNNVKGYLQRKMKIDPDTSKAMIDITIKRLDGLSNFNYLVSISNMTTNENISQIIYRKFGEISDVVDRDLETMIINSLSDKGVGPKIYESDPKNTYRIDEFLVDTVPIPNESKFEPHILEQINQICVSYSMISHIYRYETSLDSKSKHPTITFSPIIEEEREERDEREATELPATLRQTIFGQCTKDMYNKAMKGWEAFSEAFKANIPRKGNEKAYENFEKYGYYMKNFHDIYMNVFPQQGYLILNHNDVHRLNLIINQHTDKLFILDHEYASLNQIGNDIANFMNESVFNYSPDYYFKPELMNFDFFYGAYLNYLDVFQKEHEEVFQTSGGKEIMDMIKTKKYYINLHCCLNLFWLLYCGIYLNFSEYFEAKGFSYFQHAIDRIEYFECAKREVELEERSYL